MTNRLSRTVCSVVLIMVGQAVSSDGVTAPQQASVARHKACDTSLSRQSPPKRPTTVSMALMGLGLVAVGAATRRSTIKRP